MSQTLADALGAEAALSKSDVSRVCEQVKTEFEAWRERRLDDLELDYLPGWLTGSQAQTNGSVHRHAAHGRRGPQVLDVAEHRQQDPDPASAGAGITPNG